MSMSSTPIKKHASYQPEIKSAQEFGGPVGALFLILWSHYILFYFWSVNKSSSNYLTH